MVNSLETCKNSYFILYQDRVAVGDKLQYLSILTWFSGLLSWDTIQRLSIILIASNYYLIWVGVFVY